MAREHEEQEFEMDHVRDENPGRGPLGKYLVNGDSAAAPPLINAVAPEPSGELIAELCREFAGADSRRRPEEFWAEVLDFLKERGALAGRKRAAVALPQWIAKFHKILRYIKNHPNSTAIFAVLYIWEEPMLDEINRFQSQTEFAASIGLDKAAVNNAVIDAQKFFKRAPRRDQRKDSARDTMSRVRIEKLEGAGGEMK